jgi:cell division ATPase FtsA
VFSVPGDPVDTKTPKALFHTRFFADRIRELGFTPLPINEAMAIGFSETQKPVNGYEPLAGLCISFGAGMINVALLFKSLCVRSFSLPMGGDWIDEAAAQQTNTPLAQVTMLKEEGLVLNAIKDSYILAKKSHHDTISERQAEAVVMMYRELLTKLAITITQFFARPENRLDVKDPLPVIISGGTSMIQGFPELFDELVLEAIDTRLPLAKKCIQAKNPMTAVAMGALQFARLRTAAQESED